MRNLKKILALVLALVMSLSLMATASAADFKDASDITDKYQTAIEVLEGLGVFKGYDENGSYSFKPQGSITRAETAAIIYRIVTGDVTDSQVGIYADYNIFKDVPSTAWYAGYVNFCANAEYIKGIGNDKFDPQGQVTGYAALAMILRAIGYTANGGFTGSDWAVQTARTAEARKITKNINTGLLGEPANRETVAEILFQAILVNMVDHNVLNTLNGNQGYTEIDMTLGYKTFKLEQIQGVVVGNEFADLYSASVLANGKTDLEVAKDDIRHLDISTEITDIGESRYAYITGSKVLAMGDTGLNKVTETGAATDISTPARFRSTAEMNQVTGTDANATQFYVNFGRTGNVTCDQRLEFTVTFQNADAMASFDNYAVVNISAVAAADNLDGTDTNDWTVSTATLGLVATNRTTAVPAGNLNAAARDYQFVTADYPVTFRKIIRADLDISESDLAVLYGIFGAADDRITGSSSIWSKDWITGDVWVGTISNVPATAEEQDLSNKISYKKFVEDYLNPETYDVNWNTSVNGDWVKFVDNDSDGDAEYAFVTHSWLDEATGTYTNRAGDTITEYYWFNEENSTVRYMDGNTPAVGDVVVAALIDGQILVEPAKSVQKTVNNYNWRDDTITTTDGDTYGQSGIRNRTEMQELISTMADRTEYIMYFDHFGYVRAYELPGGTQYVLLTEIYAQNNMDGNVLQNWPMTVELKAGEAETHEYSLATDAATRIFVGDRAWTEVTSVVGNYRYYNWLQPAIAHLGVTRTYDVLGVNQYLGATKGAPNFVTGANWTLWPDWNQYVKVVTTASAAGLDEFNYGPYDRTAIATELYNTQNTYSFTNVAVANINGETAALTGAAQLRLNTQGQVMAWNDVGDNGVYEGLGTELPRYSRDYIQLSTANVAAQQVNYRVHPNYAADAALWSNGVVNATHNTEFYIVHNDGIQYFKDYVNMPALDGGNYIYAAYAVARDTSADNATLPYWVADVIVYEVRTWNDDARSSIALAYFNEQRTTGDVQLLKTLSTASGGPMVDLVPVRLAWNAQAGSFENYSGYDFYQVWNGSAVEDGQMSARRITRIPEGSRTYASYGIYAGVVDRVTEDAVNGGYIYVSSSTANAGSMNLSLAVSNNVYEIQEGAKLGGGSFNQANGLRYSNLDTNQVRPGDLIIWVGGARNANIVCTSSFIVDLGNPALATNTISGFRWFGTGAVNNNGTPTFLENLWTTINAQQGGPVSSNSVEITVKYEPDSSLSTAQKQAFADLDKGDYPYSVPKGLAQSIAASDAVLTIAGWTAYSWETERTNGGTLTSNTTTFPAAMSAANLQGDVTLTVYYKPATTSFQVTTNGTPASSVPTYKLAGEQGAAGGAASAVSVVPVVGGAIPYGASFEVRIPFASVTPTNNYVATVTNGAFNGTTETSDVAPTTDPVTGDLYWTGTVTGDTAVAIAGSPKPATEVATIVANLATATSTPTLPSSAPAGKDLTFTLTPGGSKAIQSVSWEIFGGAKGTIDDATVAADGKWTCKLPAAALVAGKTTTITVVESSTTPVDVTLNGSISVVTQLPGGAQVPYNATPVNLVPGQTLTIIANEAIDVTQNASTPLANAVLDHSDDYKTWTVDTTAVTADGALDIAAHV